MEKHSFSSPPPISEVDKIVHALKHSTGFERHIIHALTGIGIFLHKLPEEQQGAAIYDIIKVCALKCVLDTLEVGMEVHDKPASTFCAHAGVEMYKAHKEINLNKYLDAIA